MASGSEIPMAMVAIDRASPHCRFLVFVYWRFSVLHHQLCYASELLTLESEIRAGSFITLYGTESTNLAPMSGN
jgi:hypothetical protein